MFNQKKLEEYKTLYDYNIEEGTKLYLIIFPLIEIFVKYQTGKIYTLEVRASYTIKYLKELFCQKYEIFTGTERFIFNRK